MKHRKTQVGMLLTAVALAFAALPAFASGAELKNSETGLKVPVGSWLEPTQLSNGMIENAAWYGIVGCHTGGFRTQLAENSGTKVRIKGLTTGAGACTRFDGTVTPIAGFNVELIETKTPGTGVLQVSFELQVGLGPIRCPFKGEGTFTYTSGSNLLAINVPLKGPEQCRRKGPEGLLVPTLTGNLVLNGIQYSGGKPIIIG